jgi:aspartate aminotransferase-like enzyme
MKWRLLCPGPTPVPEETLLEMARPVIYHRSAAFRELLAEVTADLQTVFCTANPVVTLSSSGTGGLEAALVNAVPRGKKAICLSAGRFGERWKHLCVAFGIEPIVVSAPYGKTVQREQLARALADHADAAAVCSTLSETATGVVHDIRAFGKIVGGTSALLLVDAISGMGALECRTDDWQIDLCCVGSQKALMMPPGLAFVSISPKAWKAIEQNANPCFYFDLKKARAKLSGNDTPFTPALSLLRGLRVSLKKLVAEGIENIWQRQARYAAAARAGFIGMGLEIFPDPPNNALTVVKMPDGLDSTVVMERLENKYGLKLANGQDVLKGRILRLGHMGYIDQFDIMTALAGIELVLHELGHPVVLGQGLAAAQRVWASEQ